jgi:hypothetical protein
MHEWLTQLGEKVGMRPPLVPPIDELEILIESTEDTVISPLDSHPTVHPCPPSPPPPPSVGATAIAV